MATAPDSTTKKSLPASPAANRTSPASTVRTLPRLRSRARWSSSRRGKAPLRSTASATPAPMGPATAGGTCPPSLLVVLLRQPRGFEGFGPVGEVLHPHDRPILEGGDLVVQLLVDLDPAFLASSAVAKPGRHAVTGIDELLRGQPEVVERFVEPLPEAPDLIRTPRGVGALLLGEHPVDLGIKPLDGGVEVTAGVWRHENPGVFDGFLPHPPPSPTR